MADVGSRVVRTLPYLTAIALILWAWRCLDFFDLESRVILTEGGSRTMPNALASVDHPFHAARFGELLGALGRGQTPRWVAEHQGGYPSEFYSFGGAMMDLLVWLATLGQLEIPMVHTWAVAIAFALPALGLLWLCSLAGITPWAGVAALAAHLCVRGWWWSGGSRELVEWGLFTNVLASYLTFLALVALIHLERSGLWRWIPLPSLLIAWGIWTNPRSLVAVGVVVAALLLARAVGGRGRAHIGPLAVAVVASILLAAPLLLSLVRYNDLYYFVLYHGHAGFGGWLDSSVQAVSLPVFAVMLVGLIVALRPGAAAAEVTVAFAFLLYSTVTLYLVEVDWPTGLAEQLETTRLMPFQRLLMIALAGIAVGRALAWLAPRIGPALGLAIALLVPLLYVLAPPSWIPESDRGLVREGSMATPGIADLRTSVGIAGEAAAESTALLILGHTDFWHDHLWATIWSDRRFYYDDWLWYWQQEHVGEYDPAIEHSYPLDSSAIDAEYLRTHGIGAVVVTGQARDAAASAPFLTRLRSGIYDVYHVNQSTSLVTLDGAPARSKETDGRIEISGVEAGGVLTVRQNWFPRWEAAAAGADLEISHRPDGYMDVRVWPGTDRVTLTYGVDAIDWLGRALALVGVAVLALVVIRPRPTARSEPR